MSCCALHVVKSSSSCSGDGAGCIGAGFIESCVTRQISNSPCLNLHMVILSD
jgi:hypothetical protein